MSGNIDIVQWIHSTLIVGELILSGTADKIDIHDPHSELMGHSREEFIKAAENKPPYREINTPEVRIAIETLTSLVSSGGLFLTIIVQLYPKRIRILVRNTCPMDIISITSELTRNNWGTRGILRSLWCPIQSRVYPYLEEIKREKLLRRWRNQTVQNSPTKTYMWDMCSEINPSVPIMY